MANTNLFADLHCHTLFKYIQRDIVDLWEPIGKPNLFDRLIGIPRYTTADLKNLAQGEVQIACVALTPPEQKTLFFQGKLPDKVLEKFSSFVSGIPANKVRFYQSEEYDHYKLLIRERDLYIGGQKISGNVKINSTGKKSTCRYKVVKNFAEVESILNTNNSDTNQRTIAIIFTIESMHALGTGHVDFNGNLNKFNVSDEVLLKRVDALKGIASDIEKAWEYSPAWVTMTHAFNNGICGYAQPLLKNIRELLDYSEPFSNGKTAPKYQSTINTGLTPIGKKVIERLLGIDPVSLSRTIPGKRIHIDTKHMSTKSRQEYYDIIDTYNNANPGNTIPVIMSHAAVNGKPNLNENNYNPVDSDSEYENGTGFNTWSINLYDDEIIRIHKTKGIIGLVFYEPILGGKKKRKGGLFWNRKMWAELFADQIEHIVKTVYNAGLPDKKEIWDRIALGSDFDGQINPADKFGTADQFPDFKKHLISFLRENKFNPYRDISEVNELADKICYKNAMNFLKTNF